MWSSLVHPFSNVLKKLQKLNSNKIEDSVVLGKESSAGRRLKI
jgi:hypothetical protein